MRSRSGAACVALLVVPAALASAIMVADATNARADEPPANSSPPPPPANEPVIGDRDANRIIAAVNADANATPAPPPVITREEEEAPPPIPRHKGIVLESALGGLAFLGKFRQVSPTAPWLHVQAGYEIFSWLMLFGEGELAFTDTSIAEDPTRSRAFPIFGFGGGARITVPVTARVGLYAQGSIGAMKADIATNGLGQEGFRDAESLGLSIAGRLGVEWYQVDRHIALGLAVGLRDAQGFAHVGAQTDTPLMLDASLALRYTF